MIGIIKKEWLKEDRKGRKCKEIKNWIKRISAIRVKGNMKITRRGWKRERDERESREVSREWLKKKKRRERVENWMRKKGNHCRRVRMRKKQQGIE